VRAHGAAAYVRFYWDGVEVTLATLPINGSIDEVRVFNRALSASEILSIYQTTP